MIIKPIETLYHNHYFRSRREARWATCFDALDIRWEYETEGYKLNDSDCYLPDFLLPDLRLWVEVKGQEPTAEEYEKAAAVALANLGTVVITWEYFDDDTRLDNLVLWKDEHGVFHSQRGLGWLANPEVGWRAARLARFDGKKGLPWCEIGTVRYGELHF